MPYTKISEYVSKKLFDNNFPIHQIIRSNKNSIEESKIFLDNYGSSILKVDQFVKRRGKKGLLKINITSVKEIEEFIEEKIILHR
jgi:succinyl-CoA synthetase beta subunit